MKKLYKEFKTFIARGNVLDMAVGIIIGSAFTAIVTALTSNILQPFINWIIYVIAGGKGNLEGVYTFLAGSAEDLSNAIYINWGAFLSAIINFILIAIVLFSIVKTMNKIKEGNEKIKKDVMSDVLTKADRKELKKRGIKLYEIDKVKEYKKEKVEKLLKEQEELKAEEERKNNPTTQDLLKDIKALLEKQVK